MKITLKLTAVLAVLAAVLVALSPGRICAQDPFGDPFGETPAAPTTLDEPEPEEEEAADDGETDPVVLTIRATNPSTPEQLMEAIKLLVDFGRPDEAKKYAQLLLGLSPDPNTLAQLQQQFGSGLFVRLMRRADFQPEGEQLGKAVLEAGYQAARDPALLQALVEKLSGPDPELRYTALVDLRDAGETGVVALIAALADDSQSKHHDAVRDALIRLGSIAEAPLTGALESPSANVRKYAIEVLGRSRAVDALPFLLKPLLAVDEPPAVRQAAEEALPQMGLVLPSRQDAEMFLQDQVMDYLHGRMPSEPDLDGNVLVWRWDAATNTTVAERLGARMGSLWVAGRLATELRAISPDNAQIHRLQLIALLELAKTATGLDLPLPATEEGKLPIVGAASAEVVELVLAEALDEGLTAAAIGALEALAQIGDVQLLHSDNGRPREVVRALQHLDRRVRFAAAAAIMAWDPQWPFAGSSYLPEALAYFARSSGSRRVLIGHPRTVQAQTLVGMLNELGFRADTAATGRDVLRAAVEDPDYEFVLLSDALDHPRAEEVIQQFRRQPSTAALPVGFMAREMNINRLQRITESDLLAMTFPRPHDVAGVALQARRLLALAGIGLVDSDWRLHQAEISLQYLIRLAENRQRYRFYDLLAHQDAFARALNNPRLANQAAQILGYLGTPFAQRMLVTMASQNSRGLRERESAAGAFHEAVGRHGLLLTRNEILLQYDRYNRTADLDQDTQRVLGAILDTIERKE
jgi:hypothetical protein